MRSLQDDGWGGSCELLGAIPEGLLDRRRNLLALTFHELQAPSPVRESDDVQALLRDEQELRRILSPVMAAPHPLLEIALGLQAGGKDKAPKVALFLSTTKYCGFTAYRRDGVNIWVEVRPKVSGTNVTELLRLAGRIPWQVSYQEEIGLEKGQRSSFLSLLVTEYIAALDRLFKMGGLRRDHALVQRTLQARVRGQVAFTDWLRNFAGGRPDAIPCRYSDHVFENLANRSLAWASHLLRLAARADPGVAHLLDRFDSVAAGLSVVPLTPVCEADLRSLNRLPSGFDHYRESNSLPLATFIIRSFRCDFGQQWYTRGLSLRYVMHELFQQAFLHDAARRHGVLPTAIGEPVWPIVLERGPEAHTGSFRPDIVLEGVGGSPTVIIDTKWKFVLQAPTGETPQDDEPTTTFPKLELKNADLFQMFAYMQAYRARSGGERKVVGVLVYPVQDAAPEKCSSFRLSMASEPKVPLDLYLMPWNVENPRRGLHELWQHIHQLTGATPSSTSLMR